MNKSGERAGRAAPTVRLAADPLWLSMRTAAPNDSILAIHAPSSFFAPSRLCGILLPIGRRVKADSLRQEQFIGVPLGTRRPLDLAANHRQPRRVYWRRRRDSNSRDCSYLVGVDRLTRIIHERVAFGATCRSGIRKNSDLSRCAERNSYESHYGLGNNPG